MYREQKFLRVLEPRRLKCQALMSGSETVAWQCFLQKGGVLCPHMEEGRKEYIPRTTPCCKGIWLQPTRHTGGEASHQAFAESHKPRAHGRSWIVGCAVCCWSLKSHFLPCDQKSHLQTWLLCSLPLAAVFFWSVATYKTWCQTFLCCQHTCLKAPSTLKRSIFNP